jgi:hypothetical protein
MIQINEKPSLDSIGDIENFNLLHLRDVVQAVLDADGPCIADVPLLEGDRWRQAYPSDKVKALIQFLLDQDEERPREWVSRGLRAFGFREIERGSLRGWLPYDFWSVAIDETEHWQIPDEWKGKIKKIEAIKFFNRSTVTHICSPQPNYWLEFLDYRITLVPDLEDRDDAHEIREEIWDWCQGANNDSRDDYYSTGQIDKIIDAKDDRSARYGHVLTDLDDLDSDDFDRGVSEIVREDLQGNPDL